MIIDLLRLIGCFAVGYFILVALNKVRRILYTHILAKMFGDIKNLYGYGNWAIVTGSTDGIGKGYARELARRGQNVLLISRNPEKLEKTKNEIMDEFKNVDVRTVALDFGAGGVASYEPVKEAIKGLEIGVLVNNVGASNDYPEYFLKYPNCEKACERMLNINCLSVTEMTAIVLPQMIERKSGAIINIASASAFQPTPFLTVYAATKSFVSFFTRGLISEYVNSGVIFQCVYPYFVATNMSKIKRPSFFAPDANYYARCALNTVGLESETVGCLAHALQQTIYALVPDFLYNIVAKKILLENRDKYLHKQAKENKEE